MHYSSHIGFVEEFRKYMKNSGIVHNNAIIPDGNFHRFYLEGDKQGSCNGWYVMHLEPVPCAAFGSWKTGHTQRWCTKSQKQMTRYESEEHHKLIIQAVDKQKEVLKQTHEKAAIRANEIYAASDPAKASHPYLVKKRIPPFFARQQGSKLILPICDFQGNLRSLQFIYPDGSKRLLAGGRKKRMHIPVNGSMQATQILLISEGWATGATLALLYPSACVIAAVDAQNLEAVAVEARINFQKARITICADDDRQTRGNPGATYGKQAAIAAGASFELPQWPAGTPDSLTDYNDLACWIANNEEIVI